MRNSSASERLMNLMAETVSLLDAVKDLREGLELQPDAEDTVDALEHVRFSFAQAFDALKIAENEAVDMEKRVQLVSDAAEAVEIFDEDELERFAEAERMQYESGDDVDEDDTPTLPML